MPRLTKSLPKYRKPLNVGCVLWEVIRLQLHLDITLAQGIWYYVEPQALVDKERWLKRRR